MPPSEAIHMEGGSPAWSIPVLETKKRKRGDAAPVPVLKAVSQQRYMDFSYFDLTSLQSIKPLVSVWGLEINPDCVPPADDAAPEYIKLTRAKIPEMIEKGPVKPQMPKPDASKKRVRALAALAF